jgi:hypothetical protein
MYVWLQYRELLDLVTKTQMFERWVEEKRSAKSTVRCSDTNLRHLSPLAHAAQKGHSDRQFSTYLAEVPTACLKVSITSSLV